MEQPNFKITCVYDPSYGDVYALYAGKRMPSGSFVFAKTTMESHTPGSIAPAMLRLNKEELSQLMNELWHIGIRPIDYRDESGELRATQEHLRDLKEIAYYSLGITK